MARIAGVDLPRDKRVEFALLSIFGIGLTSSRDILKKNNISLDTRVRVNMLVDEGQNHIKRIEVIRPRGNAVVFDFAWDAAANQFSPIGTPDGYNGRAE